VQYPHLKIVAEATKLNAHMRAIVNLIPDEQHHCEQMSLQDGTALI
jgi:hypothetical protein